MRNAIFLIFAVILLFVWVAGWAMFHLAGGAIHLLLVLAVISFIAHFLLGRRAV